MAMFRQWFHQKLTQKKIEPLLFNNFPLIPVDLKLIRRKGHGLHRTRERSVLNTETLKKKMVSAYIQVLIKLCLLRFFLTGISNFQISSDLN